MWKTNKRLLIILFNSVYTNQFFTQGKTKTYSISLNKVTVTTLFSKYCWWDANSKGRNMKSAKLNRVMHTLLHQTLLHRSKLLKKINQVLLAGFLELNVLVRERGIMKNLKNLKVQAQNHASHLFFKKNTCRNNQEDPYYQSSAGLHAQCLKKRLAAHPGSMKIKITPLVWKIS